MAGSNTFTLNYDTSIGGELTRGLRPGTNCGVTSSSIIFCAVSGDLRRFITIALVRFHHTARR
jgi:hypothetical protein